MLISDILTRAKDLHNTTRRGAFAFDVEGVPVHPLAAPAVAWDPVGAVQKIIGAVDGVDFDNALRCLTLGAMKATGITRSGCEVMGIIEIHEEGAAHTAHSMWGHAIQAALRIERTLPAEVA